MTHLRKIICTILIFILQPSLAFPSELPATVAFDKQLVAELARAYLKSQFRQFPDRELPNINWEEPYISASMPVNGRQFIFVGFLSTQPNSGATIVFESCATTPFLLPQHAGAQGEFMGSYNYYNSLAIKETDLESICPEPYE